MTIGNFYTLTKKSQQIATRGIVNGLRFASLRELSPADVTGIRSTA